MSGEGRDGGTVGVGRAEQRQLHAGDAHALVGTNTVATLAGAGDHQRQTGAVATDHPRLETTVVEADHRP